MPPDKQRAFQRASEIAALRQNSVPDPSLAPDLGFYSGIVQGTLPVFVSRGFTQTQSGHFATAGTSIGGGSYGMGYGGGYGYGGTSILNPNGTPSGFGLDGLGSGFGSSESFGNGDTGSPTSRVSWDLIGEADAIQSEDNANALIDLYFVGNDGLRSILDSAETANDQGNGGGSQGYGGNGGGDGYGSGEGGDGGSSAAELSGKKRVLDFNAFKLFLGKIDPIALMLFEEKGGSRIERRGAWIPWTETSVAHRGSQEGGDLTFWVDENWDELDAAIRVSAYMSESLTEVRNRYHVINMSFADGNGNGIVDRRAGSTFAKQWMKDAASMTSMGVSVYLGFLSIANEGIDLIVTVDELSQGNWAASLGLLPFIPAGGAVRIVDSLGNSKLISNHMMEKISKLGDKSGESVLKIIDKIPVDTWCFSPETLVSTPSGKRRMDHLEVGEFVCSYDHNHGTWQVAAITKIHRNQYSGIWCSIRTNSGVLEATANHPVWVVSGEHLDDRRTPDHFNIQGDEGKELAGRWVNSHELLPGDVLNSHDGLPVVVRRVELSEVIKRDISNLSIEGLHTFAVGDNAVLVHNAGWCDALKVLRDKTATNAYAKAILKGIKPGQVHAHHIVMKGSLTPDGKLIHPDTVLAQVLLKKYGIDSLDGFSTTAKATGKKEPADRIKAMAEAGDPLDNMCWAIKDGDYYKNLNPRPKGGLHSHEYQKKVYERLNNAVKTAPNGSTQADIAARLKAELKSMADTLEDGKAFW